MMVLSMTNRNCSVSWSGFSNYLGLFGLSRWNFLSAVVDPLQFSAGSHVAWFCG